MPIVVQHKSYSMHDGSIRTMHILDNSTGTDVFKEKATDKYGWLRTGGPSTSIYDRTGVLSLLHEVHPAIVEKVRAYDAFIASGGKAPAPVQAKVLIEYDPATGIARKL